MSLGGILSTAWQITWRNKSLWLLGFVAGLSMSGGSVSSQFINGGAWLYQNLTSIVSPRSMVAIVLIATSIVFWLAGTISRIGLVREVAVLNVDRSQSASPVGRISQAAARLLVPVIAVQCVVWLPILVLNLVGSIAGRSWSEALYAYSQSPLPFPQSITQSNIWLLTCGTGLLTLPLTFIDAFAFRSVSLEGKGIKRGILRAIQIIRAGWKSILGLSVSCLLVGAALAFIVQIALLPLSLQIISFMRMDQLQCSSNLDYQEMQACIQQTSLEPTRLALNLAQSIFRAALLAVYTVFQSAAFTLAYAELAESSEVVL